jgi:hypothetical protein
MENILNLTPGLSFVILALNAWIFVIFPVLVIKKLNYLTALLESQFVQDDQDARS